MTSTPPTPPLQDFIRYDLLTQKALRGVVRDVLARVARDGVPGDHHFYISFRTTDPEVRLSARLRERYPAEMTVVLQHQFWDLDVGEDRFDVGLSFGNVPERLGVPFASVTGFFDPSVQFGLKFDHPDAAIEQDSEREASNIAAVIESAMENEEPPEADEATPEPEPEGASSGGAQVVSLDKFRKK